MMMGEKIEKTRPEAATPAAPTPATSGVLIPVKEIKFRHAMLVDVPGKNTCSGLRTSESAASAYWRIYYDPRMRHHRIEYYKPGEKTPEVLYVPEDWCAWNPA